MSIRTLAAGAVLACVSISPTLLHADLSPFEPVRYELLDGSVLIDGCLNCDRPKILEPIRGTFTLTRLPVRVVGELYSMTEIEFQSTVFEHHVVRGSGEYYHRSPEHTTMTLDLTIAGVTGIRLESGAVPEARPFPAIEIEVTEDGTRDPFHVYIVRIVAAPVSRPVLYELVRGNPMDWSGSFFTEECTVCGRPTVPVPISGTFLLTQAGGGAPDPFTTYSVDAIDFRSDSTTFDYHLSGVGTYRWGGEVALTQEMDLDVLFNETEELQLRSGVVPFAEGVRFPDLTIELRYEHPEKPLVYTLALVAKPSKEPPPPLFRRGDANADSSLDISDAVHIILWLFAGGAAPSCLDAADANDDESHDLSDAILLLDFLFRGGAVPPAPGPRACGSGATASTGCDTYPPCGG